MARIRILDPTAAPPEVDPDPGPPAGSLRGKTIGFRSDRTWASFEWVIDEWTPLLHEAGAEIKRWVAGNRIGEEADRTFGELAEFATTIDVGIVGLGN